MASVPASLPSVMTNAQVLPQSHQLLVLSSPPSHLKHDVTTAVLVAKLEPCAKEGRGLWNMEVLDRPAESAQLRGPGICITGAQVIWLLLIFLTTTHAPGLGTSLDTTSQDQRSAVPSNAKNRRGAHKADGTNEAIPRHPPARVPFSHSFACQASI